LQLRRTLSPPSIEYFSVHG